MSGIVTTCDGCSKPMKVREELLGKTVKCPACGEKFIVFKPVGGGGPKPVSAAGGGAAGAPRGSRGGPARSDDGASGTNPEMRKLTVQASVLAVLFGLIVGGVWAFKQFSPSGAPKLGDDAAIESRLRSEMATEAREWLTANDRRMMGGMNERQSTAFIDRLYNMGATKVLTSGGVMTLWVAVELPADAEKRKALFEWTNNWHSENNLRAQPTPDVGQRYLEVRLKL